MYMKPLFCVQVNDSVAMEIGTALLQLATKDLNQLDGELMCV